MRGFSTWEWDELTSRSVAERAGVRRANGTPSENSVAAPDDPTFAGADARRQDALLRAPVERLVRTWKLDDSTATGAVPWLIGKVVQAVDNNEPV